MPKAGSSTCRIATSPTLGNRSKSPWLDGDRSPESKRKLGVPENQAGGVRLIEGSHPAAGNVRIPRRGIVSAGWTRFLNFPQKILDCRGTCQALSTLAK